MLQNEDICRIDDQAMKQIASRIAKVRKERNISSQIMADNLGLGYEQYRRIERGTVLVKTEYIYVIAKYLQVSVDYLLFGESRVQEYKEITSLLEKLPTEDLVRAKNILYAAFS